MKTPAIIFLLIVSIAGIAYGIYLFCLNIRNTKHANERIKDCQDMLDEYDDIESLYWIRDGWFRIRGENYLLIIVDILVIVLNVLNTINFIIWLTETW